MFVIRDGKDLETWLEGMPAEHSLPIANRALLRGIPTLATDIINTQLYHNWKDRFILPMLRSSIVSLAKARNFDDWILLTESFAAHKFASNSHSKVPGYNEALKAILRSFSDLADSSAFNPTSRSKYVSIFHFLSSVEYSHHAFDSDLISAISLDITALEAGVDLWSQPLWLDDTPEWAIRGWEMLATELTRRAPYWRTLVRWYEDRLHGDDWAAAQGRPAIPALEIARASLPDSYWKKGGKAVNQAIAKLEDYFWNGVEIDDPVLRELVGQTTDPADYIEHSDVSDLLTDANQAEEEIGPATDHAGTFELLPPVEALPVQNRAAFQFTDNPDQPIDLAPPLPEDQLAADAARREDYAELRHKADDLAVEGINRLGRLGVPIERLLALGGDLGAIRAKLLWSRINTIRIVLLGHRAALDIAAKGGERDERQLDGVVADKLTDLVETANLFIIGDANLMELDARRAGPQELTAAKAEVAVIAPALRQAAADPAITTPAAGEVLLEQAENVHAAEDTLSGRQAAELGANTSRNFVSAIVSRIHAILRGGGSLAKSETKLAWKEGRAGYYRAAGALVFSETIGITNVHTPVFNLIEQHGEAFIRYLESVFNNAEAAQLIQLILLSM